MRSRDGENSVLAKRALEAREAAGYSLKEAANFLGFNNYQSLSDIEKGGRKLTAHELSAMADLYGRDLNYFFQSDVQPDLTPLWRKSSSIDVKATQRRFLNFLENYTNIEKLLGLERRWKVIQTRWEKTDFLTRSYKLAEQLGNEIWTSLNLGSRPAFNLLNVLETELRFKVLHLPLDEGISGACVVDDTLGVGILINETDAPWRRNYDLAHELFHVVTWNVFSHEEVGDGITKTKPEKYANAFASSLLLPEQPLKIVIDEMLVDNKLRIVDIVELAKDFGVSTEGILWRLVNLGIIKKPEVEHLLDDSDFRNTDKQLRKGLYYDNVPLQFPSKYISLAFRCLMEGKISRGVFAGYIGIDRSEIDDYLNNEGFMEEYYEEIAFT